MEDGKTSLIASNWLPWNIGELLEEKRKLVADFVCLLQRYQHEFLQYNNNTIKNQFIPLKK